MSSLKLMTAITLATALMLVVMPERTSAQVMEQSQELNVNNSVKVNCTTGAYGQSSTCTAEASGSATGKQTQRIVYRADGTAIVVHTPVNAGSDLPATAAAVGSLMTGAIAAVIQLKNRVIA